ncbi:MAG: hypothetical protein GTO17_05090 [Candidatus Aminicenantes bacterium]|nr:hypothetical protein [Candidatus Aminicenantes bacterium]
MNRKERTLIGFIIFFVSFSVLSLEVIYSRIFAVLTFYHFSSMIISVALLGFGAAGSYLTLKYSQEIRPEKFILNNAFYFMISNIVSFYLIVKIRFFPLELSDDWTNQVSLLFYYFALAIPFFFAGKILSFIFTRYSKEIGILYFFDLVGGGIGSLSVFLFLDHLSAPEIVHLISIILASILTLFALFTEKRKVLFYVPVLILLLFVMRDIHVNQKMLVYPPPSKEGFNWAPPWKGKGEIEFSEWNVIERLDITKSFQRKAWDFGGDISPNYLHQEMELRYMFKDGIMSSGILKMEGNLYDHEFLKGYLQSAPYQFRKYRSVISIGFGGGIDLWIAAYHRLRRIIGVEINPLKVEILKGEFKAYSGNLSEKAVLFGEEGRHFLAKRDLKVDVIQMSGLDSYPALSSGAFALSENYVFTKEAIQSMLEHLNPEGVISINRIMFDPPRETLRMVSTMIKSLGQAERLEERFFILKGTRWGEILLKNKPFTEEEAERLLEWAEEMRFAVVYNPFEPEKDNHFSRFIRMSPEERKKFCREYVYRITPATDNSPFFFQYYKWKNLFKEKKSRWGYAVLMPVGLKLIIYSLLQVTLLGLLFIILPVTKLKVSSTAFITRNTLLYFAFIGLGFILVEIIIIQKFLVFLGGPLYSLSVALFSILVFSGIGSYFSPRIAQKLKKNIYLIFIPIIGISLFYIASLSKILGVLMHLSTPARIIMSIGLLAPLSFFMGMPFPRAVRFLSKNYNDLIPWAWAVNSIFTVFGSIFCLFLSISFGFNLTWIIALFFYFLAMLIILNLEGKERAG